MTAEKLPSPHVNPPQGNSSLASDAISSQQALGGVGLEEQIYSRRFSPQEEAMREETWKVLTTQFFQSRIDSQSIVVDLAAGDGKFIKNIQAKRRIAVDILPQTQNLKALGVEVVMAAAENLAASLPVQPDIIFMSNFLEHLPTKHALLAVLRECHRALRPGGKVMILQPNIRYVGAAYWDYIDHHIALTEHSLVEALDVTNFRVTELIPRFLPYTAKSNTGYIARLLGGGNIVRAYLRLPFAWRIFGQQTFVVAEALG